MNYKTSDTRVTLDWDQEGGFWDCPILDQEWAELNGILAKEGASYTKIPDKYYHIERSSKGEHRVLWVGPDNERPLKSYALVAVRPKKSDIFIGIPVAILIPVVAAIATAIATISVKSATEPSGQGSIISLCEASQEWVSSSSLTQCKNDINAVKLANSALDACRRDEQALHEFILPRPSKSRVLYLLGRSHGERLKAIERMHENQEFTREIALQAEKQYMENVLVRDYSSRSFTKGKDRGYDEAAKLLGLGEPKILTGDDVSDMR